MANRWWLALLVGLALVAAGCADSGPKDQNPTTSAPPDPEKAKISGVVLDTEGLPVAAVQVGLIEAGKETKTDEAGAFVFQNVPAGTYKLVTSKLGYLPYAGQVTLASGDEKVVTLTIEPVAVVSEPIIDVKPFKGRIQCSVNPFFPFNLCDGVTGPDTSFSFFDRDDNLSLEEIVIELVWVPTSAATSQELELDICDKSPNRDEYSPCFNYDHYWEFESMTSPLVLRLEKESSWKSFKTWEVGVGAGFMSPFPTFQQDFDLWVSLCYIEACPDDYSARPPPA
jgi:hypothetical protein